MREALAAVETIPGWLMPEDGAKLYELGYAASGPILEVGTYHGKSAILMALAVRDAGRDVLVYTLDVDPTVIDNAAEQAERRGLGDRIVFTRATSAAFARAYPHLRPALTFVDGDHSRAGVERDLAALRALVPEDGLILFHDFNDPQNDDDACGEIKVRPAVEASWVASECEFCGVFGACGLFRRRDRPSQPAATRIDLLAMASAGDQYRHRVRYPLGRHWRRLRSRRR